ncbi:MAG: SRPBCC domain-containing protein [Hymenobacteraceae bacterium]|nr:SRPBCC domain-containing protein [Hymenobacteraceae bacterium]MDX5397303.1 SRPBCC domain-containing protein [Hymenobacteraceae bacterium]MDX5443291.1 SRPBCC domain-containing protein [Hymenobacteraceae bacterium]MDX5513381.1 SRPBCC domain-containing protein [Hymenobacteraceae bacterium]
MENEVVNQTNTQNLVIEVELDAPRELVFKAWTEAERLAQWWGPKGFQIGIEKLNVEPGGLFHYSMQLGDTPKVWGRFEFVEVKSPEKLVFINAFSDENAGLTRAPFSETWPMEMLNVLTLTEKNGKTHMTLTGCAHNASDEEVKTYADNIPNMEQGFAGTFEQLETYLKKVQQ